VVFVLRVPYFTEFLGKRTKRTNFFLKQLHNIDKKGLNLQEEIAIITKGNHKRGCFI
jgi:hypothetical protein